VGFTRDGLFDEFVNAHLKMKVESSGWPAHATSAEEREVFLREYKEEEGIELEEGCVEDNPALRHSMKLILNS
jgi:hypothetical protein